MRNLLISLLSILSITLAWCTKITITNSDAPEVCNITSGTNCNDTPENKIEEPIQVDMTNKDEVINYTINALKENNIDNLSKVISKDWVRFSPYSYVDIDKHIVLRKDIKEAFDSEVKYVRGSEDGTGDPIILSFKDYLKKYVYDIDFATIAERNEDTILQRGNMINNIEDIYTGASTIEFFVPGINPEYEGMDRRSLTLILQQENWEWKIKAIVHSQWTI